MMEMNTENTTTLTDVAEETTRRVTDNVTGSINTYIIAFQALDATMLAVVIWILSCMVSYGVRMKKFNVKSESGRLYVVCFSAIVLAVPRMILTQIRFLGPRFTAVLQHCRVLNDASTFNAGVFLFGAFFVLWLRQRAIYAHPFMEATNRRCARVFTWATLAMLVTSAITLMCGFLIPQSYAVTPYGCVKTKASNPGPWDAVKYYALGGIMVLSEGMLLAGFIYPMVRLKLRGNPGKPMENGGTDTITKTIRRSLVCATIAVLSDITTSILASTVIPPYYSAVLRDALYDIDFFINILCIFSIFGTSKQILIVCCKRTRSASSSEATRETTA